MNKIGKVLVGVGFLLIVLSISFWLRNQYIDILAGNNSTVALNEILESISSNEESVKKEKIISYKKKNNIINYSGILSIPKLKLDLPLLNDWSYKNLNIGPCIYYGSIDTKDLVICGHSYKTHLKNIYKLNKGDYIILTDVNNQKYVYEVFDKNVVSPYNIDSVIDSGYALTLFSCYNGGTDRIVIYCNMVNSSI